MTHRLSCTFTNVDYRKTGVNESDVSEDLYAPTVRPSVPEGVTHRLKSLKQGGFAREAGRSHRCRTCAEAIASIRGSLPRIEP